MSGPMQECKKLVAIAALMLGALAAACASKGSIRPQPFPLPASAGSADAPSLPAHPADPAYPARPAPPALPAPPASSTATLIDTALTYRGTPYRNGGTDPSGFDCSGFTQWVFAQYGFALPREVAEQFEVGKRIKNSDDLKPGDLVFFHTVARGASHVGIYVADDQFIHAPSSRGVVRTESINSSYWAPRFVGGRRIEGAAQARASLASVRQAQGSPVRQAQGSAGTRRPSGGESTVAARASARSGAPDSKAAD